LMRTIFFFDSLNGFIGGKYIAYTSDGGNTWTEADIDSNMVSSYPVYEFNFYNQHLGYACGGRKDVAGVIWRTTNGGLNWSAQGISPDEIFDIFVLDSLNAITLAGDPEGLFPVVNIKTTNSGLSWTSENLPFFGLSFSIDFRTYNEGWSASGYKFLLTTNRGETWNEIETPDSSTIYNLQFTDARTGYAVGDSGVVLKLDPSLVSFKNEINTPNDFKLYQNYPNPFNPTTTICYAIPAEGKVKLILYDILGTTVETLVDKIQPLGSYCEIIDGSTLASGIYIIRLSFNDQFSVKKIVLTK
ncbi:MAG: T9SS type A sorting domain-containing protein, partial [Ignavibacteriaceae bacterium]